MSIHASNPELEAQLKAQRRNSTIASLIVGILLMLLLGLVFHIFKDYIYSDKVNPIVSFGSDDVTEDTLEKEKITSSVKSKPSAPSSSAVKVITATAQSEVAIPTPDVAVDSLALDFGEQEGFGSGFGDGFGSGGFGNSGGTFSFMGSKSNANDIVFVIDWSASMDNVEGRFELLQAEMKKTFEQVPDNTRMQLIMFAGPMWLADDKNNLAAIPTGKAKGSSTFRTKDAATGKEFLYKGTKWAQEEPKRKRKAEWVKMSPSYRKSISKVVDKGQLVWGTNWARPLTLALEMSPSPKTIIFLTDGVGGSSKDVEEVSQLARKTNTVIKTITLMEPQAEKEMRDLALNTKGSFTLVTGLKKRDREVTDYSSGKPVKK